MIAKPVPVSFMKSENEKGVRKEGNVKKLDIHIYIIYC